MERSAVRKLFQYANYNVMNAPQMLDTKLTFGGAFFMSKYSYEERLEAVLRVVEEGMSANKFWLS